MLSIRRELIGADVAVLHLTGRIAVGRPCQEIESQIEELIGEKRLKVVLDLAEVQRMDSTGFGTVVMCSGKLRKLGGELRVAGANGMVEEIAHSSQISKIVPFHASVAEAVAGFAPA